MRLFHLYAPVSSQDLSDLFEELKILIVGRLPGVIIGDLNTICFVKDRVVVAETKVDINSASLNGLIEDLHLDAHIVLGLVDPYFNFFSESGRIKSRIDLCLFSELVECLEVKH